MSWVDVTTAIGTAGAVVVALGLGLRAEQRAIRLERRQREYEERSQAVHVAAWMLVECDDDSGRSEVDTDVIDSRELDPHRTQIYVIVQNASSEPIWDVVIHTPGFVKKSKGSTELRPIVYEDERVVVGPQETLRLPITASTVPYNRLPLEVEFRDNAGRDWRRDDRGRLHRGRKSMPFWSGIEEIGREKRSKARDRE